MSSLRWGRLAPAGSRIAQRPVTASLESYFPGWHVTPVGSGTEALAASLSDCARRKPEREEVIVPGYCCPDLLAAIIYCGLKPVVIDIQTDDPNFDTGKLKSALSDNTLAIIAVNFMGIAAPLSELRSMAHAYGSVVIEDNAQWFPEQAEVDLMQSDYVTFSMGRGKGISVLGGGLVLSKEPLAFTSTATVPYSRLAWRLKCTAYHLLTEPLLYGLVERLPGLNLGATSYHSLQELRILAPEWRGLIGANIEALRQQPKLAQRVYEAELSGKNCLSAVRDSSRTRRLLRYPVLFADSKKRDAALSELAASGLGATAMYATELSRVEGVSELAVSCDYLEGAASFAGRFLTLPTHDRVSENAALSASEIVQKWL